MELCIESQDFFSSEKKMRLTTDLNVSTVMESEHSEHNIYGKNIFFSTANPKCNTKLIGLE